MKLFKNRIEEEKYTVTCMISMYCRNYHKQDFCPDCSNLRDYAMQRLGSCKFGNKKPVCAKCPVHCYRKDERAQIQKIMKFAGPRMLLHYPLLSLLHTYRSLS